VFSYRPSFGNDFEFFSNTLGKSIKPGEMTTDKGSIPKILQFDEELMPDYYLPAYIIHDWLFVDHHKNSTAITGINFLASSRLLSEAIKTIMELGGPYGGGVYERKPVNKDIFFLITLAVASPIALRLWGKD
jgi:hypothetical protein